MPRATITSMDVARITIRCSSPGTIKYFGHEQGRAASKRVLRAPAC